MPPPRRQSAAPKTESKAGLVVSLIFFILLTIVLAVTTYKGYDGQKELESQAASARADRDKAIAAEKDAAGRRLAYQIMTGTAGTTAQQLGDLNNNNAFKEELAIINASFNSVGVNWEIKIDQPVESILVVMKKLQQERDTAVNNMKQALAIADRSKTDYEGKEAAAEAGKKQAVVEQERFSKVATDAQKDAQDAKNFNIDEINKLKAQYRDMLSQRDNTETELRTQVKRLQEELAGAGQTIEKFKRNEDASRIRIVLTDRVHGQVRKVDSTNGLAYIDLGSADYVRPGMTFTILLKYDSSALGVNTALPKKATLEVVQVLGEKQSQARIRYADGVSSIADPVEVGDKLYKPGWKPGTPVRWALAGHFDLNGLGRDETIQLKNLLEKQGVVVKAYLDLATLKTVGELDYEIDYLVVGNRPTGETARILGDDRKTAIEDAINDMVAKAQKMGITVMQHRVFLPIAGVELPRQQALPFFPGGAVGDRAAKPDDEGR